MIRSFDGDIDFVDLVARVLQVDILVPYIFIICLDYIRRISVDLMKGNDFTLKKARNGQYLVETMRDADSTDDLTLDK